MVEYCFRPSLPLRFHLIGHVGVLSVCPRGCYVVFFSFPQDPIRSTLRVHGLASRTLPSPHFFLSLPCSTSGACVTSACLSGETLCEHYHKRSDRLF